MPSTASAPPTPFTLRTTPYRSHGPLASVMAPSLIWPQISAYLCFAMGGVLTLVLVTGLLTDSGCPQNPKPPHVLDGLMYAGAAIMLGVLAVVSSKALQRWVRAHVRSKAWLTNAGAGLLTLAPALVALAADFALGSYFYFQDLFLICLDDLGGLFIVH